MTTIDDLHLARLLPGTSPIRRLWAGSKLLALVIISVTLSIAPTWRALGAEALVVALGVAIARIPAGARPRLPKWFGIAIAIGGGLALLSGGDPSIDLGALTVGFGGLDLWARAIAIAAIVVTAAMLLSWTTPVGQVAPALARLGRPLRWLRVPVDEWAVATGLALRCLPLLIDEIRTMLSARRLRSRPNPGPAAGRWNLNVAGVFALIETILVVSMRRAREMGEAIESRGGWSRPVDDARFGWRDAAALTVVGVVGVMSVLFFR